MDVQQLLGEQAGSLLGHTRKGIPKDSLTLPGPDYIDRVMGHSDRSVAVLRNLADLYDDGRLGGSGYLSILPVDQGVEHSAAASFARNPEYFDPANLCRLAVEGGRNAIASTLGVLGMVARRYAHRIPFIVKLNHNELLTYPNHACQVFFASVRQAFEHDGVDYETAADLTGQANHLGVTIEADLIKQKQATCDGGYPAVDFRKTDSLVYSELTTDHAVGLNRWQVANCYLGRIGLINSGGGSEGKDVYHAGGPARQRAISEPRLRDSTRESPRSFRPVRSLPPMHSSLLFSPYGLALEASRNVRAGISRTSPG